MSEPVSPDRLKEAHDDLLTIASVIQLLASFAPDDLLFQRDMLMTLVNRLYHVEQLLPQLENVDKTSHANLLAHYDAVVDKKEQLHIHVEIALQDKHLVSCPSGNDRILMKVLWGSVKGAAMWEEAVKLFEKRKAALRASQQGLTF